jgi:aspartate/methionine/tyrosine aminotransferase
MPELAQAMGRLGMEGAFEVLDRAKTLERQGRDIVHLEIGEPDFDTPLNVVDKAKWALDNKYTHYTPSGGFYETRDAFARYISRTRGVDVTWENVVVTPGAKPVVFFGLLGVLNPGEEAIYANPGYPTYESAVNFIGGKPVPLPLLEENEFRFDVNDLERLITPNTKVIIINFPTNPTGGIASQGDMEALAELAIKHDLWVLSDEIYWPMIYDGAEYANLIAMPGMQERMILLDGHSKYYAMTGWRLGFVTVPKSFAESWIRMMNNSISCTCAFTQLAGIEAVEGPQDSVHTMISEFKARRDLFVNGLNEIEGLSCRMPKGAFYAFPNVKSFGRTSKEIQEFLLEKVGVACLSGTAFGRYGEGYIRFSYANSRENLAKALDRLHDGFRMLREN